MMRLTNRGLVMCGVLVIAAVGVGCTAEINVPGAEDMSLGTDELTLTTTDRESLKAGLAAIESLATAASTAQSTTDDGALEGFGLSSATVSEDGEVSRGECPEVTLATDVMSVTLAISVDFGDGCEPLSVDDYTVSGRATGTFTDADSSLSLTFDDLTGNGNLLDGDLGVSLRKTNDGIGLDGDWNLAYTTAQQTVATVGAGQIDYARETATTTIIDFSGTVSDSSRTWGAIVAGVATSFQQNGNFIPFSGSITLTLADGRRLTLVFGENSPTSGQAEVSINDLPAIEVDLFDLVPAATAT